MIVSLCSFVAASPAVLALIEERLEIPIHEDSAKINPTQNDNAPYETTENSIRDDTPWDVHCLDGSGPGSRFTR